MQLAALCAIFLVCGPTPTHQQQDSTAIHRLIFESIKNPGESLRLDKRVLEINGRYDHVYQQLHDESYLQDLITIGLVGGICEPMPSSRLPSEKWRCYGNQETTAVSIGHIKYDVEEHAECFVYWDSVYVRRRVPGEPTEYSHSTTLEKYLFRLGENGWIIEDKIGLLDTTGSWRPPPEYPVTNVDQLQMK